MALPLTLSNYAIPFAEESTPIIVTPSKDFLLTSFSVTGFARRSCVVNSFEVYCEEPAIIVQMDLNGIGLQNYYADLVEGRGDFYDQETTSPEWLTFTKNADTDNVYIFTVHQGIDIEMLGLYGNGNIQNVVLDVPPIQSNGDVIRQIPLSFYVVGTENGNDVAESGVINITVSDAVKATDELLPQITYIENLATRINTSAEIVLHGKNFVKGMNVYIIQGETVYTILSKDITFNDDGTMASFLLTPKMLNVDGDGMDACGTYEIHIGFDQANLDRNNLGLIRYKYDEENYAEQQNTPARYTGVGICFVPSDMSLVYDMTDESGATVSNPAAGKLGKTMYVRIEGDCTKYKYVQVRLKLNYSLAHKYGESYIDGVRLLEGDVVWLTHQINPDENGLWVVSKGEWQGYDDPTDEEPALETCPKDCYKKPKPAIVDDTYVIDLGARVSDKVDYVCADDVPYKCGSRTACSYRLKPGDVILLSNQKDGQNGLWYVTCGDWVFMGPPDANDGTTIDVSRSIIVQNDIDFCKCGETYHIDYYYLNASCYLNHLQREVKLLCTGASIVPNNADHQVSITEYSVTVGEAAELVGYRGRTPGDPVKEDCVRKEPDFEYKAGMGIVENLQDMPCCAIDCIKAPDCVHWCDIPKFYNIRMTDDYKNSNDTNGFTIKFWRHEEDGWHLYAYIGSGTNMTGMDYYVYHLHVKGAATEHMVDVNEHSWFTDRGGVLATGDTESISPDCDGEGSSDRCEDIETPISGNRTFINSFALTDDTWQLPYTVLDPLTLDEMTLYSTELDSDEKLYSLWQIKCTTNILAHRLYSVTGTLDQRLNCADMEDAERTALAAGTPEMEGYIAGMRHVWGFNYYKSVMSKQQFCDEYNKYKTECVYSELIEALGTDEYEDEGELKQDIIGTDDGDGLKTDRS
jgi:hypothetical protein